jgi:hypothetical protein
MSEVPPDEPSIAATRADPGGRKAAAQEAKGAEAFAVPLALAVATETAVPLELALFVTEEGLHQRIAPHLGRDRFRAALKDCERDLLFPRIHTLWRGRYWPAVRAWLDRNQGVSSNDFAGSVQDGPENFDAPTR